MRVFFDERFYQVYTSDPAAEKGRLNEAVRTLKEAGYPFLKFQSARDEDVRLVHSEAHLADVHRDERVYPMALLAAGATLAAARSAMDGEPAFALVRPPGHHASPNSCWGFCYFNNVAVALAVLLDEAAIGRAVVLDIDLHFGDGSENYFDHRPEVQYLHPEGHGEREWLANCRSMLDGLDRFDLLAVSAGFDRHRDDWGEQLSTAAYARVGRWVKAKAERMCSGRTFVVLEGGYNPDSLAQSAAALLGALS